jgi:hypothetical protein
MILGLSLCDFLVNAHSCPSEAPSIYKPQRTYCLAAWRWWQAVLSINHLCLLYKTRVFILLGANLGTKWTLILAPGEDGAAQNSFNWRITQKRPELLDHLSQRQMLPLSHPVITLFSGTERKSKILMSCSLATRLSHSQFIAHQTVSYSLSLIWKHSDVIFTVDKNFI